MTRIECSYPSCTAAGRHVILQRADGTVAIIKCDACNARDRAKPWGKAWRVL